MKKLLRLNLIDLPTKKSLKYYWCSGFMVSGFLVIQIISGMMLCFLYVADQGLSFACVMELTKDSFFAWLIRYMHIWGVSFIFLALMIHICRALYYSSYTKILVWKVGFMLYLLMMIEAFLGYMLPWHQMSYWAATVLTSVMQSIPVVGLKIYYFIVGGFSVSKVTLVRVFGAHMVLAFMMIFFSLLHLFYLHKVGSKNSLFVCKGYSDYVYFHSYFFKKDLFCLLILYGMFLFFIFYSPDFVLDLESYLQADPLVTPVSMKPEWYFLFYYAMLRSVSSKLGGLILVMIFLFLLWLPVNNYSCIYSVERQSMFWSFCALMIILSYLGACPPDYPYIIISQMGSFFSMVLLTVYKGCWIYKG